MTSVLIISLASAITLTSLSPDARHDLSCLETASKALEVAKPGQKKNMFALGAFYTGRLSGRDDSIAWFDVAKRDLKKSPHPIDWYANALGECVSGMTRAWHSPN